MKLMIFILLAVTLSNAVKAAETVTLDTATNEEQCLELAVTDDEIDQCMDQAY